MTKTSNTLVIAVVAVIILVIYGGESHPHHIPLPSFLNNATNATIIGYEHLIKNCSLNTTELTPQVDEVIAEDPSEIVHTAYESFKNNSGVFERPYHGGKDGKKGGHHHGEGGEDGGEGRHRVKRYQHDNSSQFEDQDGDGQ
uniref:Cold and drought-regulated protein CORA-like n=1 Tax=Rhabditophanes sp. KR3021 TaxID=114890 RepID=A0AC35U1I7_9BILA